MRKNLLTILAVFGLAVMVFAISGCKKESEAAAEPEARTYVFASDVAYPPLEFVDDEGEVVGFDIDLMAAIAEEAGFEYEIRNTAWDGIFAGLANGSYDGVISAVTITDERKAAMDFSEPYINAGQILVVRADYSGGDQLEDFVGKSIGVQQGTTGDFAVEAIEGIKRKAFDENGLAIEDLVNGNLDAVVCDSTTAVDYVVMNPAYEGKLKVIGEPFTEEYYGIAVQKGDTELLNLINEGLAAVEASGKQEELVNKWFR